MTVKQLKEQLKDLPDNMPIVLLNDEFKLEGNEDNVIKIGGYTYMPWEIENIFLHEDKYIDEGGNTQDKTKFLAITF